MVCNGTAYSNFLPGRKKRTAVFCTAVRLGDDTLFFYGKGGAGGNVGGAGGNFGGGGRCGP